MEFEKNKQFRLAGREFAEKADKLASVLEIAIVGSVAGDDPYPGDIDLAVIVKNLGELPAIAKYARQMSRYYYGWEVFLFDEELSHLGRVCNRKKCPGQSLDCSAAGCGLPPHLQVVPGFEYDEKVFFRSPFEIVWSESGRNRFLARKEKLGIDGSKSYPVLEDMELKCALCGKRFIFEGGERKFFQKRGFRPPRRCPECRARMQGIDPDIP
jgi:DNA-directed RNA polymerase subunit RPC12/RpoP